MSQWDPNQYRRFAGERFRPGYELMARLGDHAPRSIVDLGCGTGELTVEICRRYPAAITEGLDSSREMLQKARALSSHVVWVEDDIATWSPKNAYDLIFSNAALQWVGNHETAFPKLVSCVAPHGTFAVQIPANFEAPSHLLIREALAQMGTDASFLRRDVLSVDRYIDFLQPHFDEVDVWQTEYVHFLSGPDAVFEWVRGTALRPVMATLGQDFERFAEIYRHELRIAYPIDAQGITRFPFRRLFAVGRGRRG